MKSLMSMLESSDVTGVPCIFTLSPPMKKTGAAPEWSRCAWVEHEPVDGPRLDVDWEARLLRRHGTVVQQNTGVTV